MVREPTMVSQQGLRRPGARDRALARQSAGRAGLGRLRGGRRAPPAGGAFSVHRGAGTAAALARRRLLPDAAGARGLRGGLGFRLRLAALARGGGAAAPLPATQQPPHRLKRFTPKVVAPLRRLFVITVTPFSLTG